MRVVVCLLAAFLLPAAVARAESAPFPSDVGSCGYSRGPHTSPPAGDLPANWPRIVVRLGGGALDFSMARLEVDATGAEVATTILQQFDGVHFVIDEPLVVGETYRLVHPSCAGRPPETTVFVAVDPIPPPTSLGTLSVSPLHASYDARGRENLRYFVRVTLTLDPSMVPWIDLYTWALSVNGRSDPEEPFGLLEVDVPIGCNPRFPGEPEGLLSLDASATDVWDTTTLGADAIETTTVCDDAILVHIGNLEPLTDEEIAFYDMPGPMPEMDAGMEGDGGGVDGGRMGMHTEPDTHSTCSCTAAGRGERASAPWALMLVGAFVARRRWRRTKR